MEKQHYQGASNLSGSLRIKDLPIYQRPREKALRYGLNSLSNSELLAILINSGTKGESALLIADNLLNKYLGLTNMAKITEISDLNIKGIKATKALTLLAAFKLSERIQKENFAHLDHIQSSAEIANKYLYDFSSANSEMLLIVALDKNLKILKEQILYIGTKLGFEIDVRSIVALLKKIEAKFYILVHNHPSGNNYPSTADLETTKTLKKVTDSKGFLLYDHLIIASYSYFSFKDNELI